MPSLFRIPAPNDEIRGLKMEIIGLAFLLISAVWQGTVIEVEETHSKESLSRLDAEVAAFRAYVQAHPDEVTSSESPVLHSQQTVAERIDIVEQFARSARSSIEQSHQLATRALGYTRFAFAIIGTALLLAGKIYIALHKNDAALKSNDQRLKPPMRPQRSAKWRAARRRRPSGTRQPFKALEKAL